MKPYLWPYGQPQLKRYRHGDLPEHRVAGRIRRRVRPASESLRIGCWAAAETNFYRLTEPNNAVAEWLTKVNDGRVLRQYGHTRRAIFEEIDAPNLRPL
ncbi:hypothetical protein, partial [Bradyrhizobium sp. USDA 4350]